MEKPVRPGPEGHVETPVKLVMNKLTRPPPIPELAIPSRLRHIVEGLFPQNPLREKTKLPPNLSSHPNWKIDKSELQNAANSHKTKVAPSSDGISNETVKSIAKLNPEALIKVYNTCFENGILTEMWKTARLVLIRKGDKPLGESSSYRPLCLLDCLGKLLE